jgi:hypothetical protein
LGAWLAGILFMDTVVIQNFQSVDRLLAKPAAPAAQLLDKLGPAPARMLLRHQVSEQNRWFFEAWGVMAVALGATLLVVLVFGSTETKATVLIALLMLLVAIVQRFALTTDMVALGRAIDWVPRDQPLPERSTFWMMHNAYVGLELVNLALGTLLAGKLLFRSRKKPIPDPDAELMERRSAAR